MSVAISSRFKSQLEKFIAELKEFSLLPQDDPIIEGFYTLLAEKVLYYGILTQNQLILIQKKYMKLDKAEIIQFKKIDEISLFHERRRRELRSIFILLGMIPVIAFLFWILDPSSLPQSAFKGFLWGTVALLVFVVISTLYLYLRGFNIIKLVTPGKIFKLQSLITWNLSPRDIVLFNIHHGRLEDSGLKMDLEGLYQHLNKSING